MPVETGSGATRKSECGSRVSLIRAFDQAFEQALQFIGRLITIAAYDVIFLAPRQRIEPFGERLAAVRHEHQNLAAVGWILNAIDESVGHHPVDHFRQRRMIQQNRLGEFSHRMAVAIGKDRQDAPMLNGDAFFAQTGFELPVDLPVRLGEQIREMFGNRRILSWRFGHGGDFALNY